MAKGFKINGTDFDDLFEPVRDGFGSVTFTGLSPECTYMAKTGDSPNPNADGYYKYNGTAYSAHKKGYLVPKSLTYSGTWGTQNESTAVNTSGITFTVTYQDGTTETVTPSVSPSSWAANSGNQTATFSYTYHGVTVSTTKNCNMTYSYTTASAGNGSVSGSGTYVYNASSAQTKTIDYSANTGYQYSSWSCSGGSSCSASGTTLTINAGCHGDITATCSFSAIVYTITMATNNSTYGTTSINTATYTISGSAQTRTVTATVKDSNIYQFNSWSTGKGSISGSTLTIPANTVGSFTVTGNFGLKTFTVTVQSGGHGSVSGSTTYSYSSSAQTKTIGYSADSGYKFNYWSVSGPTSGAASASGTTLTIGAGAYGNITVTGYFELVVPSSLSISGDWSNTQYTGQAVNYTGLSFTCTYSDGSTATVTPSSYSPTTWSSTAGTQTCTFYYTENGISVSAAKSADVVTMPKVRLNKFGVDRTATSLSFT